MTSSTTIADEYYRDKVKLALAFAELPEPGGARAPRRTAST